MYEDVQFSDSIKTTAIAINNQPAVEEVPELKEYYIKANEGLG